MKATLFVLMYFCFPPCLCAQLPSNKGDAESHMASGEYWRLKNDSARSNSDIRKAITIYTNSGRFREAAEAWLILENYYAFFNGPGYGPRIAYYDKALKLFNRAHVKNRAADTRAILGNFYLQSAEESKQKKDSARANVWIRKAITIFLRNGQLREAAEAWLTLENYYAFFHGLGYGPRIAYYEKGLALFKQAGIKDRAAATMTVLGDFYQHEGRDLKALSVLKKAAIINKTIPNKDPRRLYSTLGSVNIRLGNYDQALEYAILTLRETQAARDTSIMLSHHLNGVGTAYSYVDNFQQALVYYNRAFNQAKAKKNLSFIVTTGSNLAFTLKHINRFEEAYRLMTEIDKVYQPSKPNDRLVIDRTCLSILTVMKRYAEAKKYCDRIIRIETQLGGPGAGGAIVQQSVGKYFMAVKNYNRAGEFAERFKKAAILDKDNQSLLSASALQYQIDSAKGDKAAELMHYREFVQLKDRTFDETKTRQVAQLEIQYETEKKDQLIKAKETNISNLKKQAELQAVNIRQRETTQKLTIAGAVLLAMLLALSYNRYRLKQRVNRQLQQKQSEINKKNRSLTELITEKDNLLEEKEWLMKEIHHRVKNNLQIVMSLLNTQSSFLKEEAAHKAIRDSQHRIQSISLIHQKLYESDSMALVNMPAYISDLLQYLNGSLDINGRIRFETDISAIELDVTKSVPLGLILNEAITNAVKYAFPDGRDGRILIGLREPEPGSYELSIRDNGAGLAEETDISKSKTLGMSLMRGLAKQLSGTFSIQNSGGITITVGFSNL